MTKAILIGTERIDLKEIDLDIDPKKNQIMQIFGSQATFIGQWPDIDVVILKSVNDDGDINKNMLPYPFTGIIVRGPILLVRMDENSEPRDFTLKEYKLFRCR
jgi:hypothetical protein